MIIFSIILFIIYKIQKPSFKNRKAIKARVSANLTEAFIGIKVIKGFTSNEYSTAIFKREFFELFQSIKRTLISANILINSGVFFMGTTTLLIRWFGSKMSINNELTMGDFTTFIAYLTFLVAPVFQIARMSSQFTDANASIERINETLELANE
tara:strand:+ start:830 stop:1291 length:462 start_codon:yes stop_codon:yes gene_type:complete